MINVRFEVDFDYFQNGALYEINLWNSQNLTIYF